LSKAFVFKGGTALRKAYFPNYRFSEDIDFTVKKDYKHLDEREINTNLKNAAKKAGEISGIHFEVVSLEKTRPVLGEEAYEGKVQYIGPMGKRSGSLPRIKLDITFYENIIFPTNSRLLIHSYSDSSLCIRNIEVYSIDEVLAEKLRSILQRNRPRDIYDLWQLLCNNPQGIKASALVDGFKQKCRHKNVTFDGMEGFFTKEKLESHSNAWESSLGHQLPNMPKFADVVNDLQRAIADMFME
jgi:predicted nucleotidyltransferase component of viral defense system